MIDVPGGGFEVTDPPVVAPMGVDATVWALARAVWSEHVTDSYGLCVGCGEPGTLWPCPLVDAARRGFEVAALLPALMSTRKPPRLPSGHPVDGALPARDAPGSRVGMFGSAEPHRVGVPQ